MPGSVATVSGGATAEPECGSDPTTARPRLSVRGLSGAVGGTALAGSAIVALWTVLGWSSPTPMLALEGLAPVLLAVAYPALAWAVWRRRPLVAVVSLAVGAAHLAVCIPAATADARPAWTTGSPTLRVLAANVRFDNSEPAAAARMLVASDVDVLVLSEVRSGFVAELDRRGLRRRFPDVFFLPDESTFGDLVASRVPVTSRRGVRIGSRIAPVVTLDAGGAAVEVWGVHPTAPDRWDPTDWRRDMAALVRRVIRSAGSARLVIGDFNSTPWTGEFGALIDAGLRSCQDATGDLLHPTWGPELHGLQAPALIRLDECLFSPGTWPTTTRRIAVSGSDHVGQLVELAVRR